MSVYKDLVNAVKCGKKVHINLVEKTAKINGNEVNLDNKELITEEDKIRYELNFENPWDTIEDLYSYYKRSVPSATVLTNKSYFKADDVEELDNYEMAFNMNRNEAQVYLEAYVLLAGLSGWLKFENDNHWFWQSTIFPELVCLKEWI